MRRSFTFALVATLVAAAAASVLLFWLPAHQAAADRAARMEARTALHGLVVPASLRPDSGSAPRMRWCSNTDSSRCFVTSGTPRDNVAAVQAALGRATGSETSVHCVEDGSGAPNEPGACVVTISGSRLEASLFARATWTGHRPTMRFHGTNVAVTIAGS